MAVSRMRRSSAMLQGIIREQASKPLEPLVWSPTMTFSSTLMVPNSSMFWNVRTMPRRARRSGGSPEMSLPSSVTLPDVRL